MAAGQWGETIKGVVQSMGLVFGDIGTSPIYTLTVIFLILDRTTANVYGVLSLMFWTLVILITGQYVLLAMPLSERGEGGSIVLREYLLSLLKKGRGVAIVSILSLLGVSLIIGDGIITPAISILSAVEGIRQIPGMENTAQILLVGVASVIAVGLFTFQQRGMTRISWTFGPVMGIWFGTLTLSGIIALQGAPEIVGALNPIHALTFIRSQGLVTFLVLSNVILVATGGEALFADIGHLGKEPIRNAWVVVFIALTINYFGQGAYLITHPGTKTVLFGMVSGLFPSLYLPFLFLTIIATIIASQAIIAGIFSAIYQSINTRLLPWLQVQFTSPERKTQIYIGTANWFLLISVLLILWIFQTSDSLANAYGLAVTGSMTITGIFITAIYFQKRRYLVSLLASLVALVDGVFLISTALKIPDGAYWSLILASVPLFIFLIYTEGRKRLRRVMKPMTMDEFLGVYQKLYQENPHIRGTSLCFLDRLEEIPVFVQRVILYHHILYEDNVFVSLEILETPFGVHWGIQEKVSPGIRLLWIKYGFMEVVDMMEILKEAKVDQKVIFFGEELISSRNPLWRIFSLLRRQEIEEVEFFGLPTHEIHGIIVKVSL